MRDASAPRYPSSLVAQLEGQGGCRPYLNSAKVRTRRVCLGIVRRWKVHVGKSEEEKWRG